MNRHFSIRLIRHSFWLAPLLMLVADLSALFDPIPFFWASSISFWLSFYVFLLLILGMLHLANHSRLATVGALLAGFGALVGATIIGMSRFAWGVEAQGVSQEIIRAVDAHPWVFFSSRFPGITFPLGLIIMVIALQRNKVINSYLLVGLMVSIILFPVGRIPKELVFNVIGDSLMVLFFGIVGRIYARRMQSLPDTERTTAATHRKTIAPMG